MYRLCGNYSVFLKDIKRRMVCDEDIIWTHKKKKTKKNNKVIHVLQ